MYSSSQCNIATPLWELTSYGGLNKCYLAPDRGDIPAYTPAEAGTGMQG